MARVAVVTGASRGIGRGVSHELANQDWNVYATGRSVAAADLPRSVRRLTCDHTDDQAVAGVFAEVVSEAGQIDVLVNGVWGGYERMVEDGRFTWGDPFWLQPRFVSTRIRYAFVRSQTSSLKYGMKCG